jgi:hypothetical protein
MCTRCHQLELVPQPREARRRSFAREEFARMRLECEDTGSQSKLACLGRNAIDERAMAAVHAVKIAYGQRAPAPGFLQ